MTNYCRPLKSLASSGRCALMCALIVAVFPGCDSDGPSASFDAGLSDAGFSEMATVTYEDSFPVEFIIDANELCVDELEWDCEGDTVELPEGENRELIAIEFGVDVDIIKALEEGGEGEIPDPREVTERMRSIEITGIDYKVDDNALTFDLPDLDLYVAPMGARSPDDDDTIFLTTIPSVEAGQDESGEAPVDEAASEPSSELFQALEFAVLPSATPVVREGQPFPPSGDTDVELTFNIKLVANPVDEL